MRRVGYRSELDLLSFDNWVKEARLLRLLFPHDDALAELSSSRMIVQLTLTILIVFEALSNIVIHREVTIALVTYFSDIER